MWILTMQWQSRKHKKVEGRVCCGGEKGLSLCWPQGLYCNCVRNCMFVCDSGGLRLGHLCLWLPVKPITSHKYSMRLSVQDSSNRIMPLWYTHVCILSPMFLESVRCTTVALHRWPVHAHSVWCIQNPSELAEACRPSVQHVYKNTMLAFWSFRVAT